MNALPEAVPTFRTGGQGDAETVIYFLRPEFVSLSSGKQCVTAAKRRAERTYNTPRVEPCKGCVTCIQRFICGSKEGSGPLAAADTTTQRKVDLICRQ